jgi:hypothetical protein
VIRSSGGSKRASSSARARRKRRSDRIHFSFGAAERPAISSSRPRSA